MLGIILSKTVDITKKSPKSSEQQVTGVGRSQIAKKKEGCFQIMKAVIGSLPHRRLGCSVVCSCVCHQPLFQVSTGNTQFWRAF